MEDAINDMLFRAAPIKKAGHKFKFIKLSPSLISIDIAIAIDHMTLSAVEEGFGTCSDWRIR